MNQCVGRNRRRIHVTICTIISLSLVEITGSPGRNRNHAKNIGNLREFRLRLRSDTLRNTPSKRWLPADVVGYPFVCPWVISIGDTRSASLTLSDMPEWWRISPQVRSVHRDRRLGLEHSAHCQICKISLRSCGANPVQVRILLVCHASHESVRSSIKKGVERFLLSYVEAGLPMTHPESCFCKDALNRVCAIRTRGDNLIKKSSQQVGRVQGAARQRLQRIVVLVPRSHEARRQTVKPYRPIFVLCQRAIK